MDVVGRIILFYVMVINMVTFLLFGLDKRRARKKQYRIPEKILLVAAAGGGSVGAFTGMYMFRHKTKHVKFYMGIPLLIMIHILAVLYFWRYF